MARLSRLKEQAVIVMLVVVEHNRWQNADDLLFAGILLTEPTPASLLPCVSLPLRAE